MAERDIFTRVRQITQDRDYASQLIAVLSERELSDEDAQKLIQVIDLSVLDDELPFLKALAEVARYEGFDPRVILASLLASHSRYAREYGAHPEEIELRATVGGEEKVIKYSSNEPFSHDMQFICLMFITRGAAFDKIMKKSSEMMTQVMALMKAKYSINTVKRKPGSSLDSKTITIPRIAASLPSITVGMFHKGFGRSIVDPAALFPGVDLPRVLFSPMIASMLPTNDDSPLAVVLAIAVRTDDILHQTDAKTKMMPLFQYLMASFNSQAQTEPMKARCAVEWGLGTRQNGTFTYKREIVESRERAKAIVEASRAEDDNLAFVLSQV